MSVETNKDLTVKDYLNNIIKEPIKVFNEITKWSDKDFQEYNLLLE